MFNILIFCIKEGLEGHKQFECRTGNARVHPTSWPCLSDFPCTSGESAQIGSKQRDIARNIRFKLVFFRNFHIFHVLPFEYFPKSSFVCISFGRGLAGTVGYPFPILTFVIGSVTRMRMWLVGATVAAPSLPISIYWFFSPVLDKFIQHDKFKIFSADQLRILRLNDLVDTASIHSQEVLQQFEQQRSVYAARFFEI